MSDTNSAYSAPIPSRKIRFHQRRSAEERLSWVRRHQRSGQTLKQFCAQHALSVSSLCLWRKQFSQNVGARSRAREDGSLVEVPLRASVGVADLAGAVIQLLDGTRIEVNPSMPAAWIAGLLRALRGSEREG